MELFDTIVTHVFWISLAALVYVHVGYSAILWLVQWLARFPAGRDIEPSVTLIIPAYNEASVLQWKIENALAIDYPRDKLEIIVASDGSTDETNRIAEQFADRGVRLLAFGERRGKASVLNDAVAEARGEVICFCDANVRFERPAMRTLINRLGNPSIGAATGDVRLASHESNFGHGESLYYRLERAMQLAESRVGSLMGVDGGMYVMWRELFRPLPADTILDDFVISMNVIRQGKRVVYEPAAVANENGTPRAVQEYRRRVRVSAGAVQSLRRRGYPPPWRPVELWQFASHKLLRWMGPLLLLTLLASSAWLWQQHSFYWLMLIAQLAGYALAVMGFISLRFRQTAPGGVFFYFALSHVAMVAGQLKGVFLQQEVTWAKADRGPSPAHDELSVHNETTA